MLRLTLISSFAVLVMASSIGCKNAGERSDPAPRPRPDMPATATGARDDGPPPAALEADEIVYHFQDASVPPPDHRSVTITATTSSIVRVVDSYGDEIERQEQPLSAAEFRAFVANFETAGVSRGKDVGGLGCTGGTSESIRLSHAGAPVFTGTIEHCGGTHAADFGGDLDPLISALKARVGAGG